MYCAAELDGATLYNIVYLEEVKSFTKETKTLHKFIWVEFEWRVYKGTVGAFKHMSLRGRRKEEAIRKGKLKSREYSLTGARAGKCHR